MAVVLLAKPTVYEPAGIPLVFDVRPNRPTPTVEIVIPVHDEEAEIAASVQRLHRYLSRDFPLAWLITIADHASTDDTWRLACRAARDLDHVRAVHLDRDGRGRALRTVWSGSLAPVRAYLDVDRSIDLDAVLPLVAPLVSGHSDVSIGSRRAGAARATRGAKGVAISRCHHLILRATLQVGFSDARCGFMAIRGDAADALLPMVEDDGRFFDTELLVLAERNGLRIHEVPVDWIDDSDFRATVAATAEGDLRGIARVRRRLANGDAMLDAPRRGEADRRGRARRRRRGQALALLPLASNVVAVTVLGSVGATGLGVVLPVLTLVSAVAGVARSVLLDRWAFGA